MGEGLDGEIGGNWKRGVESNLMKLEDEQGNEGMVSPRDKTGVTAASDVRLGLRVIRGELMNAAMIV